MVEVAGKAAILVDPDDEKAIEQAIYKIVNQPKIADELRQKGIANLERFSWEKTAHETVKVYKYALSKS
jgi:glycosyltransferase involved in cell wall biosynthesis